MAIMIDAMELMVMDTEILSMGISSNASSISANESMAMPTRPTSPFARGSSEFRPICVGRSNATLSPVWPCSIRYLKRLFVSVAVAKPEYWRMVYGRERYIYLCIPRVNGYSPGSPISRLYSISLTSSGV